MTVLLNFNGPGLQAASARGTRTGTAPAESDSGQKRAEDGTFARLLQPGNDSVKAKIRTDSAGTRTDRSGNQVATATRDDSADQGGKPRGVATAEEDSQVVALRNPDINPLPAAQSDSPAAAQPAAGQENHQGRPPARAADTQGDTIAEPQKPFGDGGPGRPGESLIAGFRQPAPTPADSSGLGRATESAPVQASPNPAASADAKSNNTSLLRQLNNARAANSNRSPVAAEQARATVPPESGVRSGTTPASQPPLPNATEQAQSASGRLSSEGLVLSPGRDMNRGTPDASDYNQAEESDRLTGKELPESGKPLPSVLTHSPAQFAPGLADRVEQMTRRVGIGRQKLAILDGKETAASDRLTSEGLRLPTTELFSRLMSQAHPLAPAGEAVLVTQSSAPDSQTTQSSQAASLLASVQASAERSSTSRPTPLTGLDSGNGFSVHIQPDSLEWSNQLGNRIRWMSNLNLSSAELKLYPAELGTLEIHIASEDDQARVSFITSNAAAKEIIESSLPRLRELLGQSGLLLEQGDVTYRDSGTGDSRERVPAGNGSFAAADRVQTEAAELSLPLYRRSASENRIDQFA